MASVSLPLDNSISPVISTSEKTTQTVEPVTNLTNVPQTWGKAIPFHTGSIRVAGAQIWSSDFYSIVSTTVKTTTATFPASEIFGISGAIDPKVTQDTTKAAINVIDVGYSFGYNALSGKRVLVKLRFDGTVVYDLATGINKFDFDVYYGSEDKQDPTIKLDEDDLTPYYPGQIYIVSQGIVDPLPTQVDAEFAQEIISGDDVTSVEIPAVQGKILPDYINRIIYTYDDFDNKLRKYNIDTFESLRDPIAMPALQYGGIVDKETIVWFQKLGVFIAQEANTPYGFWKRLYAINPETGAIVAYHGSGTASPPPPNPTYPGGGFNEYGMSGAYKSLRSKDTATDGTAIFGIIRLGPSHNIWVDLHKGGDGNITFTGGSIGDPDDPHYAIVSAYYGHGDDGLAAYALSQDSVWTVDGHTVTQAPNLVAPRGDTGQTMLNVVFEDHILWLAPNWSELRNRDGTTIRKTDEFGVRNGTSQDAHQNYPNCTCGYFGSSYVGWVALFNLRNGIPNPLTADTTGLIVGNFWDCSTAYCCQLNYAGSRKLIFPLVQYGGKVLLRDWITACYVATQRFTADQITFDGIDDEVYGALLVEPQDLNTSMDAIRKLYRIEKSEVGNALHFYRNRDDTTPDNVAAYIDYSELAVLVEGQENLASLNSIISGADLDRPMLQLSFIDKDADYATNTVAYKQPGSKSTSSTQLSVPLVLDKTIALQLLTDVYGDAVAATTTHSFRLPYSLAYIGSGDIVGIYKDQFRIFVRITEDNYNGDFSVSVKAETVAIVKRPKITDTLVPDKPKPPIDPTAKGTTLALILDLPALRDDAVPTSSSKFQQFALVYSKDAGWKSGYLSRKNGEIWKTLFLGGKGSNPIVCKAVGALAEHDFSTDVAELTVSFQAGVWKAANNKTAAQLYASDRENLAAYGVNGRWEIVRFQRIEGGKVKGIIRGCRGTEWATGLHETADWFVVLNAAVALELRDLPDDFEVETYRPVTANLPFASGADFTFEASGQSLKPWAVYDVAAEPSGSDLSISWKRRDRAGGGWGMAIPTTDPKNFEVDVLAAGGAVLRTLTATNAESVIYTAANQATDSFSGTLRLAIYQIGAHIGRGIAKKVTINV